MREREAKPDSKIIRLLRSGFAVIAFLCFVQPVRADYYAEGTLLSTNLLSGATDVAQIVDFTASATLPSGTTASVQFSQNGTDWYTSVGIEGGWDTLSSGTTVVELRALDWTTANFYYRVKLTSTDPAATPLMSDVSVNYSDTYTPYTPPWEDGHYAEGALLSTNLLTGLPDVAQITDFTATAVILGSTTLSVQFSRDGTNWYNSTGTKGGWNTLSNGETNIDITGFDWTTADFYYRAKFTSSDPGQTPTLTEVTVEYSDTYTPPGAGNGYHAEGTVVSTDLLAGTGIRLNGAERFGYDISSLPGGTSVSVQFSRDGTNWYSASGVLWSWSGLSAGTHMDETSSLDLAPLSWSNAESFYYKLRLVTAYSDATAVVREVALLQRSAQIQTAQPPPPTESPTLNLNNGLVLYQSFNGPDMDWSQTSAEARDRSGGNKHGDVNGAGAGVGKRGQGLVFDGVDDYVSQGDLGNNIRTVTFWIKTDTLTSQKIIDFDGTDQIELDGSGNITATSFPGTTTVYVDAAVSPALTDGWHHITITDTEGVTGSAVNLGRVSSGYFDGTLDEVRFYTRVLSAEEVGDLYREGEMKANASQTDKIKTGLVGMWSFDGPDINGTTAYDRSGQGNNGTISGATASIGKLGQAMSFDGLNDSIGVANESNFDFDRTDPFSISVWIKYNTKNISYSIISKQLNAGNFPGFDLKVDAINNRIATYLTGTTGGCGGGDCINNATAFNTIKPRRWEHIALTYDGSSTAAGLRLFINGVDRTQTGGAISSSPLNNTIVTIGDNPAGGGTEFDGRIDDLRVYDRTLSTEEVGNLYRLGQALVAQ